MHDPDGQIAEIVARDCLRTIVIVLLALFVAGGFFAFLFGIN